MKVKGSCAESYKVRLGWAGCRLVFGESKNHLHKDAVEIFEKADKDIKSAIREVKGE